MTATWIPLGSGVVHVESSGDPHANLVLCVHGLSANCRSFDRLVPQLVAAGHHVVTMDLRGRGRSETTAPGTYGWDRHASDLVEIADHFGADTFDLVGHSMGGFIGMTLAATHPDRCARLVLVDALGVPEAAALPPIARSVGRLGRTFATAADAVAYVRNSGAITAWNEFWDNYFAWEIEPAGDATVRIRTDLAAVTEDSVDATTRDVYALWPRIRCPVLLLRVTTPVEPGGGLIVSAQDAERFAALDPTAIIVEVDSDHYTVLLDPIAIDAIERFLRR
jgi:pimeloyl-ACP methyl ester carboxylesterase